MCEYFTRLIFESVHLPLDSEIPLQLIKNAIKNGHENSSLLCMFCGADIWQKLILLTKNTY